MSLLANTSIKQPRLPSCVWRFRGVNSTTVPNTSPHSESTAPAEQKIVQAAHNLLKEGFDTETIIQILGLSREDVEKLR